MPTSQRHAGVGVIDRLLAAPQRFDFFQAVGLIERSRPGSLRFRNRLSLGFPPNEVENIAADDNGIRLTPAFLGMLGSQGALPLHYSERIGRHERRNNDGGPRAFFDIFTHRILEMFYQAWSKHRPECLGEEFRSMLHALAGDPHAEVIDSEALAFYAMHIGSRTASAPLMAGMYAEYFNVAFAVEPLIGEWQELPLADQVQLGATQTELGGGVMLGARIYRCDARVRLRIGPLDRGQYEQFLPGRSAAIHLTALLKLHCGVGMTYEVHLIQRPDGVSCSRLDAESRLGVNARLHMEAPAGDREELMYLLHS